MSKDVFHHHRGVIDENTNGENQGKQTDTVNGVVDHHCPPDGQQDHDRNNGDNHEGCAHTQTHKTENRHDYRGFHHGAQQLVDLVVGRLAVVACDGDVDVARDQVTLQGLNLLEQALGNRYAITALFLRDRYRDGRITIGYHIAILEGRPREKGHHLVGLGRLLRDLGHIAHVNR